MRSVRERRRVVAHHQERQGRVGPRDAGGARLGLRRLGRDLRLEAAALPPAVVLAGEALELGLVEVAHHDDDAVLGPVVAVVELQAVVVVVGHVPDVLQEPDRRVLVRVRRVREVVQGLAQQRHRVREVQVVLAEDGAGLGAEVLLGVPQVEEAVGLEVDDGLQRVRARHDVVGGPVRGRERVRVGPDALDHGVVGLGGVLLGAPEHHVLEEVRVAREARLDLVPRAGAHHRVVGDDAGAVVVDADHREPVVELEGGDGEGKDLAAGLSRRRRRGGEHEGEGGEALTRPLHGDCLLSANPPGVVPDARVRPSSISIPALRRRQPAVAARPGAVSPRWRGAAATRWRRCRGAA